MQFFINPLRDLSSPIPWEEWAITQKSASLKNWLFFFSYSYPAIPSTSTKLLPTSICLLQASSTLCGLFSFSKFLPLRFFSHAYGKKTRAKKRLGARFRKGKYRRHPHGTWIFSFFALFKCEKMLFRYSSPPQGCNEFRALTIIFLFLGFEMCNYGPWEGCNSTCGSW